MIRVVELLLDNLQRDSGCLAVLVGIIIIINGRRSFGPVVALALHHLLVVARLAAVHQKHAFQYVAQVRGKVRLQLVGNAGDADEQSMDQVF